MVWSQLANVLSSKRMVNSLRNEAGTSRCVGPSPNSEFVTNKTTVVQDGPCITKYYRDSKEKYTKLRQSEEAAYFSSAVSIEICTYFILLADFFSQQSVGLLKSPIYSKIQGNFKLIHEIFIKITHLGKKINTMYTSLPKTVYHHTKKDFILGKRFLIYGKFYFQK